MKGNFDEVRGSARDLISWHTTLDCGGPPFHQPPAGPAGSFAGRFRRHLMDQVGVQLIEVSAREHSVSRTLTEIAAVAEPSFLVCFQLAGHSEFRQEGTACALLGPGDYTITSTRTPYTWRHSGDFTVFTLRFPHSLLDLPERAVRPVSGQALSSQAGFGRHLAPFVSSIAQDAELLRGRGGARVARNLIDLIGTGVAELLEQTAQDHPVPLLAVVAEYVDRNLADPALSAAAVAAGCHISARYLQSLFHDQGTTVTDWIRGRRMALCRQDLADPALHGTSISEIARLRGYPDQTYFARLFRRVYGESPREWRTRAAVDWQVPVQPRRQPGILK